MNNKIKKILIFAIPLLLVAITCLAASLSGPTSPTQFSIPYYNDSKTLLSSAALGFTNNTFFAPTLSINTANFGDGVITNATLVKYSHPTNSFAGPTNTIDISLASQIYIASGNVAITNISNPSTTNTLISNLIISNSTASSITVYTYSNSVFSSRAVGAGTTNALIIAAGKIGDWTIKNFASKFSLYVCAAEQ